MIVEAILDVLFGVLDFFLGLLPTIAAPEVSSLVASSGGVFEYIGWANNFLPLDHVALAIGLWVSSYVVLHVISFAVWAWSMFTGGGGN